MDVGPAEKQGRTIVLPWKWLAVKATGLRDAVILQQGFLWRAGQLGITTKFQQQSQQGHAPLNQTQKAQNRAQKSQLANQQIETHRADEV